MGNLVLVLGMSGVGKDAVVTEALKHTAKKYERLNYGNVFQSIVGEARDAYRRSAPLEKFKDVQKKTAKKIIKLAKGKDALVTSHCVMWREAGLVPGFPSYVLDILKPSAIIVIYSDVNEIALRKAGDEKTGARTGRDVLSVETLTEQHNATINIAYAYGMHAGAPVKLIKNVQGRLDEAAKALAGALDNLG